MLSAVFAYDTAFSEYALEQSAHFLLYECGAVVLVVNVYDCNSHLLAALLQAFYKWVLACTVGLAYASLYKVAVNGMAEPLLCNVYECCSGGLLCFQRLFNEDCTQRVGCDRSTIGIYLLNDLLALEVLLQWKGVTLHCCGWLVKQCSPVVGRGCCYLFLLVVCSQICVQSCRHIGCCRRGRLKVESEAVLLDVFGSHVTEAGDELLALLIVGRILLQ